MFCPILTYSGVFLPALGCSWLIYGVVSFVGVRQNRPKTHLRSRVEVVAKIVFWSRLLKTLTAPATIDFTAHSKKSGRFLKSDFFHLGAHTKTITRHCWYGNGLWGQFHIKREVPIHDIQSSLHTENILVRICMVFFLASTLALPTSQAIKTVLLRMFLQVLGMSRCLTSLLTSSSRWFVFQYPQSFTSPKFTATAHIDTFRASLQT